MRLIDAIYINLNQCDVVTDEGEVEEKRAKSDVGLARHGPDFRG